MTLKGKAAKTDRAEKLRKAEIVRNCRCGADFRVEVGGTKPQFVCNSCGASWCAGRDGWPYLEGASNYNGGGPSAWVSYKWVNGQLVRTSAPLANGWL